LAFIRVVAIALPVGKLEPSTLYISILKVPGVPEREIAKSILCKKKSSSVVEVPIVNVCPLQLSPKTRKTLQLLT